MRSGCESMAGETSSRPTIAGFEISTRATPGISASKKYFVCALEPLVEGVRRVEAWLHSLQTSTIETKNRVHNPTAVVRDVRVTQKVTMNCEPQRTAHKALSFRMYLNKMGGAYSTHAYENFVVTTEGKGLPRGEIMSLESG
jgi:hypothetical protein